jgi:hypothetical protein
MTFDRLWKRYKKCFNHYGCSHSCVIDGSNSIRHVINHHFEICACNSKYGVYVAFSRDGSSLVAKGEAVYIGLSGTINKDGTYQGQNISGRLINKRSTPWFQQVKKYGPLIIEYICLPDKTRMSPRLIESHLLQSFLNQYGRLPMENTEF